MQMRNKNQDPAAAMPPGQFRMIIKYQASSHKPQAASFKHQAPSFKQFRMILINNHNLNTIKRYKQNRKKYHENIRSNSNNSHVK